MVFSEVRRALARVCRASMVCGVGAELGGVRAGSSQACQPGQGVKS